MIRDIERLLRVKNHVIRYWEKEVPLIQPKKEASGRHSYSDRDLQIFLRLKHLLHERHFTMEGAREELYRELSGERQDLRAAMGALRSELLRLYDVVRAAVPEGGGKREE
jgi:DNA-binding transcriptional MerR regulator